MNFVRALYTRSAAAELNDPAQLIELGQCLAERYRAQGITGFFLQYRRRCVHVLEGSEHDVRRQLLRILQDGTMPDIDLRFCEAVEARAFDRWSMHLLQSWMAEEDERVARFFRMVDHVQSPLMFRHGLRYIKAMEAHSLLVWASDYEVPPARCREALQEPVA